jgi:uncharacterized protein
MNAKQWDPLSLDVAAFAGTGESIDGSWTAAEFPRFSMGPLPAEAWLPVEWSLTPCDERLVAGTSAIRLHLVAKAQAQLTCQRCLQVVKVPMLVDRTFQFVHDEDLAAELDVDSDEDVLSLNQRLNVRQWIEDELLLELPIVPRHDVCPEPLLVPLDVHQGNEASSQSNPFDALKVLKLGPKKSGP